MEHHLSPDDGSPAHYFLVALQPAVHKDMRVIWSPISLILRDIGPNSTANFSQLKVTVQGLADSMDCGEVLRAVRHLRGRTKKCVELQGAVVEPFS